MPQVGFKPRIPEFEMLDGAYASIEECKRVQMHPPPLFLYLTAAFLATELKRDKKIEIF
jgi:hypothetical protein